MKRIVQLVCSMIVALFALVPVVAHAEEQTSYTVTSTVSQAIDDFIDFVQDEKISGEEFEAQYDNKALSLESKIDDAVAGLAALKLSDSERTGADKLSAALKDAKTALSESRAAFDAGNQDDFQKALDRFSDATTTYNTEIENLNKQETGLTSSESTTLYYALAGVTAVISAAAFAWALVKKPANELLAKARLNLALSSLWPLGGALVTLGTYLFSTDGTYLIAWGPIGVGVALFIKGIVDYVNLSKNLGTGGTPPVPPVTPVPPATPAAPTASGQA
jgi:hypothetical protein